jgi:cell division septation protein DedD
VSDEGFREIQLNGKQLIFMFMAVTVVLVVTFLFGVLVGRDVRQGAVTEIAGGPADPGNPGNPGNNVVPDPGIAAAADQTSAPAAVAGSSSNPPAAPPAEELSYAERLLRDTPPEENLKPAPSQDAPASAPVVREPVAATPPPPAPPASARQAAPPITPSGRQSGPAVKAPVAAAQASDPSGPGFAVQVAAYPDRRDAEKLVQSLASKGYPAFVMDPVQGAPTKLFRVRVGKYPNRTVAEGVQAQLAKAEQFTTAWIAR